MSRRLDETWFKEDEEEIAGTPPDESSLAHADGHKTAGGRRYTQAERTDEQTGGADAYARLSTTSLARLRSEIISGLVSLCAEWDGKIRLLFRLFVWGFCASIFSWTEANGFAGFAFFCHTLLAIRGA